jgi:hypothetical protein
MTRASRFQSRAAVKVIGGIMTMLIVAGCSDATKESGILKDGFDELMRRPNLTQMETDYQSMLQTIRERLVAEVGIAEFSPAREPMSETSCGDDLTNVDGALQRYLKAGVSVGNLPDAKWDQAVTIVTEVAKQHGFSDPVVIVDRPSDHEVSFRGTYGGSLLFGTGGATTLTVRSGCHLTEEAHNRGTYLPSKQE